MAKPKLMTPAERANQIWTEAKILGITGEGIDIVRFKSIIAKHIAWAESIMYEKGREDYRPLEF